MRTNAKVAHIRFGRFAPTVSVTDMTVALSFYVGVLGFEKRFENGDPVGFVILCKDDAELHLSVSRTHKATTQNVAHLMVDDATALYQLCSGAGMRIIKGLRGFVFSDPDGNRIDVGQRI